MGSDAFKSLTVTYKKGERIVASGETGACMFVVNSGKVRVRKPGRGDGATMDLGCLEKGDFFGERALLDGKPYGIDAEAESDCRIVEIGASVLHKMLKSNPEIAVRLLRKLSARLDQLEAQVAAGGGESAGVRPASRPEQTPEAPAGAPAAAASSGGAGRLLLEGGSAVFPLRGTEMLVGRYDPVTEIQPEIDLTGVDTKRSVSRRHSRLTFADGAWQVEEEVGALNGTFVNGARLAPGKRVAIREGDIVSFGMVRVVFREV